MNPPPALKRLVDLAHSAGKSAIQFLRARPDLHSRLKQRMSPRVKRWLRYWWRFWARPKQLAPPWGWMVWFVCAGRGFGKTRAGAEWVREMAEAYPGCRIALVGRSFSDVRLTMIEGESGILACCPYWDKPVWNASQTKKCITWSNGSQAFAFSGDNPDQLRGPQFHFAWADELAAWRYLEKSWANLVMATRLKGCGSGPQIMVTTTPRPMSFLKKLAEKATTAFTSGHTNENSENLASSFLDYVQAEYGGTRLGAQELSGEILDAFEGALWGMSDVEVAVVPSLDVALKRVVVGVDPAEETGEDNDETGIVVVGLGVDGICYLLEDLSGRHEPEKWGELAILAATKWGAKIVAETNRGGKMVRRNLQASIKDLVSEDRIRGRLPEIAYVKNSDGKAARFTPLVTLYRNGMFRHVGHFPFLETQMLTWVPSAAQFSPDRIDAMNNATSDLVFDATPEMRAHSRKPVGF